MSAPKLLQFVKPAGLYGPGDVAGFEGERQLREAATYVAKGAAIVVEQAEGEVAPPYDGPDRRAPRRRWTDHVGPAGAESAPAPSLPRAAAQDLELVTVQFIRAADRYNHDEVASFRRDRAEAFIAKSDAIEVRKDERSGKFVPVRS